TTQDPMIAERMAKDCLLLPPLPPDLATIGKMADLAVAAGPTNTLWPYFQFVKALAEFRQGHLDIAAKWLQEVTLQDTDVTRTVQAYMVLAMAQYQSKKGDEARASLTTGLKLAAERMPDLKAINWHDRLSAHFLMQEAKRVLSQGPEPQAK